MAKKTIAHKFEMERRRLNRAQRRPGHWRASTDWSALAEAPTKAKDGTIIPGKPAVRRTFRNHPSGGYVAA